MIIYKTYIKFGISIVPVGVAMMDLKSVEIAKKAITLKGWSWTPGMLGVRNCPSDKSDYLRPEVRVIGYKEIDAARTFRSIPDLNDAATKGAILQLVKDSCRDPQAYLCYYDGYDAVEWAVNSVVIEKIREELDLKPLGWMRTLVATGQTEGEALIYALEESEKVHALFKEQPSRSNDRE